MFIFYFFTFLLTLFFNPYFFAFNDKNPRADIVDDRPIDTTPKHFKDIFIIFIIALRHAGATFGSLKVLEHLIKRKSPLIRFWYPGVAALFILNLFEFPK